MYNEKVSRRISKLENEFLKAFRKSDLGFTVLLNFAIAGGEKMLAETSQIDSSDYISWIKNNIKDLQDILANVQEFITYNN